MSHPHYFYNYYQWEFCLSLCLHRTEAFIVWNRDVYHILVLVTIDDIQFVNYANYCHNDGNNTLNIKLKSCYYVCRLHCLIWNIRNAFRSLSILYCTQSLHI